MEATNSKSVSVIIVNWNGGELLNQCLQHLDKQTMTPTKIFLMDNNSTDGSALYGQAYPNVLVRELGYNSGFAVGNNKAVSECQTEFIALLNPDALPAHDWLERLLAAADKNPEIAAFGSRQMMLHKSGFIDGLGDEYHMSGLSWRKGFGQPLLSFPNSAESGFIFSACGCAMLIKTDVFKELGGFDEDYFCYSEDVDLGFRFNLYGQKTLMVSDAVVFHAGSASTGGGRSAFSIYYGHRNLVWTYVKNMPGLLFWTLLPLHLSLNVITVFYFIYLGYGRTIIKAKWDALIGIPRVWKKRKRIQAARKASIPDIWRILNKSLFAKKN